MFILERDESFFLDCAMYQALCCYFVKNIKNKPIFTCPRSETMNLVLLEKVTFFFH